VTGAPLLDEFVRRFRQRQLAQLVLDDDLPCGGDAQVDLVARIGEQKGATPAQIALAWLLAQKPWIVPIPGSRKLERLDENIGALAVELKPDDLREIKSAISEITVQGDRYPEDLKKMTGR